MRPQRRGVPAGFHGYRATLAHPGFEAGEEALELAQSASEQVVNVASLRNALSKVGRRGMGIALDDRDLVEDLAQNAGGAHPRQTTADHQSASGAHGPLPRRPANLAALMRRPEPATLVQKNSKAALNGVGPEVSPAHQDWTSAVASQVSRTAREAEARSLKHSQKSGSPDQ